jgi:hypothetical protein
MAMLPKLRRSQKQRRCYFDHAHDRTINKGDLYCYTTKPPDKPWAFLGEPKWTSHWSVWVSCEACARRNHPALFEEKADE